MLKRICVTGFRSFQDFNLDLMLGLNVLVGPNGSGKTNLIKFLEFLSFLPRLSLFESIGRVGGAGTSFRRTQEGSPVPEISFQIAGESKYKTSPKGKPQKFSYTYRANISISLSDNSVLFSHQRLSFFEHQGQSEPVPILDYEFKKEGERFSRNLSVYNEKRVPSYFGGLESPEIKKYVDNIPVERLSNYSILQVFEYFFIQISAVQRDLMSGMAYNIDPNAVREPEEIGNAADIKPNGSGLAAILFAAKNAPETLDDDFVFLVRRASSKIPPNLFEELVKYSCLVNDSIQSIDVRRDAIENKLRVFLEMDYERGSTSMPLTLCSDGTVKWLALVAAVLTNRSLFVLEEPENFLHPQMQKEIVAMVREKTSKEGFSLMTTHSETLINELKPSELVIMCCEEGVSRAKRPEYADKVQKEINRTGFGLSYYLGSGILN